MRRKLGAAAGKRHMRRMGHFQDDFNRDRPLPAWDRLGDDRPRWSAGEASCLFENPWLRLTRQAATAPTGAPADYVVVRPRNLAVGVLPVHDDGSVTLVGQGRFGLMNYSWEIPEGGAPFDEDPLAGARRELAEEAGLSARSWREVLRLELSNSISDERAIAWLAWDLTDVPKAPDATEVIATARVPFMAVLAEVERGSVRDAITVATVLRAYQMARDGRLPGALAHAMLSPL